MAFFVPLFYSPTHTQLTLRYRLTIGSYWLISVHFSILVFKSAHTKAFSPLRPPERKAGELGQGRRRAKACGQRRLYTLDLSHAEGNFGRAVQRPDALNHP